MKVAFISGASGYIGSAAAEKLIDNGYFVLAQYNGGKDKIDALRDRLSLREKADFLVPVKMDLRRTEEIERAFGEVSLAFKHIDVLVNNAGMGLYKMITETSEREWDEVFAVNVKAAFTLTNLALKSMIERKSGSIINVSSVWGEKGAAMEAAYSASKAALIGLTKSLAKELAPSGINVNCILPGVIDTPMNARFNEEETKDLIERTPLKRLGTKEDVGELIRFLCSADASYITGQAITVDGGFGL